jgi:hypothetical protein
MHAFIAAAAVLIIVAAVLYSRRAKSCTLTGCPSGQACDPASGRCITSTALACPAVPCPAGQTCDPVAGLCYTPTSLSCKIGGCPPGLTCDPATGRCYTPVMPGLCLGKTCPSGQACDPATGQCASTNPCAGKTCPSGQVCDPTTGQCVSSTMKTITVKNIWPMDVYAIVTAPNKAPLGPQLIKTGGSVNFQIPVNTPSGRLGFYPTSFTSPPADSNSWYTWWEFSNLTYVDTISQQLGYQLIGGDCKATDSAACIPTEDFNLQAWCPSDLLFKNTATNEQLCMSPRTYCGGRPPPNFVQVNPTPDSSNWCSTTTGVGAQIWSQVQACCAAGKCSGDLCDPAKTTMFDIWGCAGPLATDSPRCAAFNRGLFTPGSGKTWADANPAYLNGGCQPGIENTYECNAANYYQKPPYNTYSKGVHGPNGCPGNYSFAFDDVGSSESGSHNCVGTGAMITLYRGHPPTAQSKISKSKSRKY